jgi:hypothetical protein
MRGCRFVATFSASGISVSTFSSFVGLNRDSIFYLAITVAPDQVEKAWTGYTLKRVNSIIYMLNPLTTERGVFVRLWRKATEGR